MGESNGGKQENSEAQDYKIYYLQMIQSAIDRMSTSSAIFKGFAAMIVAGVSAMSFNEIPLLILVLSLFSVSAFLMMDVYYLRLERRFRALFEMVRLDQKRVDFDMRAPKAKALTNNDNSNPYLVRMSQCVFTKSILLFYAPIVFICIGIVIVKITSGGCN